MNCSRPYDLVAYLKGELPDSETSEARHHLEVCPECAGEAERNRSVLASVARVERIEPSPDFVWRVRRAFLRAHPEFLQGRPFQAGRDAGILRVREPAVPAWALSAALHVLVLSAVILFLGSSPDEEVGERIVIVPAAPTYGGPTPEWPGRLSHPGAPTIVGRGQHQPSGRGADFEREPGLEIPERPAGPVRRPRIRDVPESWDSLVRRNPFLAFIPNRIKGPAEKEAAIGVEAAKAVRRALQWLAKKQKPDGRWDPTEIMDDPRGTPYEIGLTSLATLAFLADGHTPVRGTYSREIERAVRYLLSRQRADGLIGDEADHYLYNHAPAALALLECLIMTGENPAWRSELEPAVGRAVEYAVSAQNAEGGWDYFSKSDKSETTVTGWMVLLLRLAFENGLQALSPSLNMANRRVLSVTHLSGQVGYRKLEDYPNKPYVPTAAGMLTYLLSTRSPDAGLIEKYETVVLQGLLELPPDGADPQRRDLYFLYYGALALHQAGGASGEAWLRQVRDTLVRTQEPEGSWDPGFDRWSASNGGRLYTTALGALILSTPWRYPRLIE